MDVVNFYDQRFNMLLSDGQKADLVAFMNTLWTDSCVGRTLLSVAFDVDFS